MSEETPNGPQPPPPPSGRIARVEYMGFEDLPGYREYRLAANGPDGRVEYRFRIAIAAFGTAQMRLQDGPDVCYQKLLREVGAGEALGSEVVTIDEVELASYRDTHTRLPKHRSLTSSFPPKPPTVPRPQARPRALPAPVAPPAASEPAPGFEEGQRVQHAVFGVGVTAASSGGHTLVIFDEGGPRKFVTSMLELELLSEPHMWETSPRGKNRPRETPTVTR